MTQVERGLANEKQQPAAILEHHVGGAQQEIIGEGGRDTRDGLHRAGRHHHAVSPEGPRRDRRRDVAGAVTMVRQRFHLLDRVVGFQRDGASRRRAQHQMRLDAGLGAQNLQEPDAVDRTARP